MYKSTAILADAGIQIDGKLITIVILVVLTSAGFQPKWFRIICGVTRGNYQGFNGTEFRLPVRARTGL